jgi:hypothetical protein
MVVFLCVAGTAKPKSAEYLHLEEFEDGSEMGESRVMANMTTALGSTYLWMAVGGTSAAIAAYGPSVFVSQRELPFRLKYTTIVNFAARSALRMGFAGATTAVSFVVAQGVLEAIRQRRDSWNTLMSGLFAGFVLNIGGGFKLGITRSVLASCFVVAIPIVQNAIEKKVSEETKEKVAATWDRYKLGTLLGWNSNSEERLPTRHKF